MSNFYLISDFKEKLMYVHFYNETNVSRLKYDSSDVCLTFGMLWIITFLIYISFGIKFKDAILFLTVFTFIVWSWFSNNTQFYDNC